MGGAVCCCSKKAKPAYKTQAIRRYSISIIETKVFQIDELGKEANGILIDIENLYQDLLETKEEILKLSDQKAIFNAIVAFIFAVAAVKKDRFHETGFDITPNYPFIMVQINDPSCKDLNAFKACLAKYLGILHQGIQKLDGLYSELLSVIEKLKKELPNCLQNAKDRGLSTQLASKATANCWANIKHIEARKQKIDKIRKTILEEREHFVNAVIPHLKESLLTAEDIAKAESNGSLVSIKTIGKKYFASGRKRTASVSENKI